MKRKRRRLLREDPHCYWCGTKVRYFRLPSHETMPDDFATLNKIEGITGIWVLSCNRCSFRRGRAKELATPLSELWALSQRPPKHMRKAVCT